MRGRVPRAREKGGTATGPSPVDRRKTGSKHHLITDGGGIPLKAITTTANVNDVTQTLALADSIPPVARRVGHHPRKRPDALLGDQGYDSNPNRREFRQRGILPVISRKGQPDIHGLGSMRCVVEQTFALLLQFKRLPFGGNAAWTGTTPSCRPGAHSSAGGGSRSRCPPEPALKPVVGRAFSRRHRAVN